ncbi:MAG: hypothetical protein IJ297_03610 [Clostridia bacterium]|nr:hypothetical protein [Clostridia bacterium]
MAEFCMECLNKISETNFKEKDFIMSKNLDFCEECCQFKHVVVVSKKTYYLRKLPFFSFFNDRF